MTALTSLHSEPATLSTFLTLTNLCLYLSVGLQRSQQHPVLDWIEDAVVAVVAAVAVPVAAAVVVAVALVMGKVE